MLPKEIVDIIYKQKTSMCVHKVNEEIKKLNIKWYKADDIWNYQIERVSFWDRNHNVYAITGDSNIRSIYLDYKSRRFMSKQWTYICGDCGEYLTECERPKHMKDSIFYDCDCNRYLCTL